MKKYLLSGLLILSTSFVVADGHGSAEKEVLKALDAYMDARNSRDFKTVIAMSSKAGTLDTNSDGSFHKTETIQTLEGWMKSGGALTQYFYPENFETHPGVPDLQSFSQVYWLLDKTRVILFGLQNY